MSKLPIYSNAKKTGNIASDILKSILQKFAIVNLHDESIDLGIDMRAQVIENNIPKEQFFNIQCKGKNDIGILNLENNCFRVQIKVSTINYWNQQNETTFLFVVDNKTANCYWCNPLLQLGSRIVEIQKNESVVIKVPLDNCLNNNSQSLPNEFKNCITFYLVQNVSKISDITTKIKDGISGKYTLDIPSSFDILSILMKQINKIEKDYDDISSIIIQNIKNGLSNSLKYLVELDQIDLTRHYCPEGVFNSTAFSYSKKTIVQLQEEANTLIASFENQKKNIEILKTLERCNKGIDDIMGNALGFLYEMVCEDDPWNDHTELLNQRNRLINKYYNHINIANPDNSNSINK